MKKIINGKRYDTKTATEIASAWNGCSRSDFNFLLETLYRTDGGAWFLAGEGGALTKYAEVLEGGRSHCGGKDIVPLTPAEVDAILRPVVKDLPALGSYQVHPSQTGLTVAWAK